MQTENNSKGKVKVGQSVFFRSLGTTYKVLSESVHGSAAIVEHTLEARSLGAPMHKHTHENEISYILEGELSVIQNGDVHTAGPGDYIVKPKGIFHTFWNPGEKRTRFIEIISPGNFEYYFAEMAPFMEPGKPPKLDKLAEIAAKYGIIVDPYAAGDLIKKYGLQALS